LNVDNLTQVGLISNIGTFLLYGMTCLICIIAFAGVTKRSIFTTVLAPGLGIALNVLMLIGVYYFNITGGGSLTTDTIIAGGFSIAWLVIGFAFLWIRQLVTGIPILHPEDHKVKHGIVRPVHQQEVKSPA
jgi:basic amino acid/polyamine antiporter, APA family